MGGQIYGPQRFHVADPFSLIQAAKGVVAEYE